MNRSVRAPKDLVPREHRRVIRQISKNLRQIYSRNFRPWLYVGNRFHCPCCNGHFRKFLTFGVIPRPNAQCPRCGSLERHRLLWLYFRDRTNLFSANLSVLHMAPEYVLQRNLTSLSNLTYVTADLVSPLAMVKMDITCIPCPDNSFDVILCIHVLEHIENDRQAMRELLRVLKPSGWAILQSPTDLTLDKTFEDLSVVSPEDRERLFGKSDHVRLYGADYKDRLTEAGFTVNLDDYVRELPADVVQRCGLIKDEGIFRCAKS